MASKLLLPAATTSITAAASYGNYDEFFRVFDKDKDGKISASELCACVTTLYCTVRGGHEEDNSFILSAEEAKELVASVDKDGDGLLGPEEFASLLELDTDEADIARDLAEAFRVYEDTNRSGRITPSSLRKALGMLGEERGLSECEEMIRRFDVDGDGGVCLEEFKIMMAA